MNGHHCPIVYGVFLLCVCIFFGSIIELWNLTATYLSVKREIFMMGILTKMGHGFFV